MSRASAATCGLILAAAVARSHAWDFYQSRIPNGQHVQRSGMSWSGVGHQSAGGGDDRNPFGSAFAAQGHAWTVALCQADSDGDGETNGEELGDPDCLWSQGDTPASAGPRSHPGFADSTMAGAAATPPPNQGSSTSSATQATPTPSRGSSGCEASSLPMVAGGTQVYDCRALIGGGMYLHWSQVESQTLDLALAREMTAGYMALAWPMQEAVAMAGSGFIVQASGSVGRYTLSLGAVAQTSQVDLPFPTTAADVTAENGWVVFRVTAADMTALNLDTVIPMIWAVRDTDGVEYHGSAQGNRGGFRLNFLTGEATAVEVEDVEDDRKVHGLLQITAWAFLAPMAVFVKRLGARWPKLQSLKVVTLPLPYLVHMLLMVACIVLSLAGVGIAKNKFTSHAAYGHETFAMLVTILAVVQPFPALVWHFCKPKPDSERFKRAKLGFGIFHRLAGISAMVFAYLAIFTGIQNYRDLGDEDVADAYTAASIAGMVVLLGCWVLVEVAARIYKMVHPDNVKVQPEGDKIPS